MAGAHSELAWAQASQPQPRFDASTGTGNLNYLNLLNFCESFLYLEREGGGHGVCEVFQELFYILKSCERRKSL